jgi:peroxiredoxin
MYHQSTRKSFATVSLIILCTVPAVLALYIEHRRIFDPLPVGQKIPSIEALSPDRDVFVQGSLPHKKLLLVFFTTACSHCRTEISNLNDLRAKYVSEIDIVGVSLDGRQATNALKEELKLKMPILLGDNEKVKSVFRLTILPAIYCIDESQILRRYSTGEHSLAFDEDLIKEFIATKSVR